MRRKPKETIKQICYGGQYSPLSDSDIVKIHNTSMQVFEEVGFKIANPGVAALWKAAGADIDSKGIARIGRDVVEKYLSKAPSEVVLCGRDPKNDIALSGTRTYLGSGGTAVNIYDPYTGERRPTTIKDVAMAVRVLDACDNVDFVVIPCFPSELDKSIVDTNRFYAAITNTSKHIMGGVYTIEGIRKIAEIAQIIAGSKEAFRERPFLSMITSVMSPLVFGDFYMELMHTACDMGFPLAPSTAPMSGSTAPLTLAGTLVQMNTEALAGIITVQMMDPGHKTLYSAVPTTTDMRTAAFCFGSVEMGMMNAAASQLARYYHVPIYNTAGPTESKIQDSQAAYEATFGIALTALAGGNYIHEASGILESGLTVSLANYVINNEVIGMVKRVLGGIEVDEEKLALECIKRVGPAGSYIEDELTTKYMRSEMYYPEIADRKPWMMWHDAGSASAEERAVRAAQRILETHIPMPVSEEADKIIRSKFPEITEETGKLQ